VGHEEQDIDEEAQEAEEEVEDAHNEQQQQVPSRVGWAVQMSNDGENEHDKSYESGDRVDDQKSREG
jgi:hypothetical protein